MQQGLLATNLKKIISLVDNLRDLGLEELIKLPKVIVVGSQSAGKSSLLEQIVGIDFLPRGSGVVTRRPLELRLTYDHSLRHAIGKFDELPNESFTDFNKVRDKINFLTDKVCGNNKNIVDKPIILNISSPSCPTITIVDLPGITANPVGDQPHNIYEITKGLVMKYATDPSSIMICVIPANQDISTSEALKLVMQVDPQGKRSLGCLTKIDIMDKGTNARNILLNEQVKLNYGFVGTKNRNNQDVLDNKPVSKSLQEQKAYFSQSPIYSTLPPGTTGTQSLTDKITRILYNQIKETMPQIIKEVASKKIEIKSKLQKFGPSVAKTPGQLIDYVWKQISKFLKVYKNSLDGMRDEDYGEEPFGPKIRKIMNEFYVCEYEEKASQNISDREIQNAMHKYSINSIPGFPSLDAFLSLLNPLMNKLKTPAMLLVEQIYRQIEQNINSMIGKLMAKQYPIFIQRFTQQVLKVLENSKIEAKAMISDLVEAEVDYLYTNDTEYLMGDFKISEKEKKKQEQKRKEINPMVYQLRKRIDAYFKIIARNLRDLIPKQISYFMLVKGTKEIQFEAYNFMAHSEMLEKWFLEPPHIREQRERNEKALEILDNAEKRIRRDPEFGKFVRPQAIDSIIKSNTLTPIVIKKKEIQPIIQKPAVQKPIVKPVVDSKPSNPTPPPSSKPTDSPPKAPVQSPPPPQTQPKPKPQELNSPNNKPPTISVPSTASSSNTQGGIDFFSAPGGQNPSSSSGTQNTQRQPGSLGPSLPQGPQGTQGSGGNKGTGIVGTGGLTPPPSGNTNTNQPPPGSNPLQRGPLPNNQNRQQALANMFGFKK